MAQFIDLERKNIKYQNTRSKLLLPRWERLAQHIYSQGKLGHWHFLPALSPSPTPIPNSLLAFLTPCQTSPSGSQLPVQFQLLLLMVGLGAAGWGESQGSAVKGPAFPSFLLSTPLPDPQPRAPLIAFPRQLLSVKNMLSGQEGFSYLDVNIC